MQIEKILVETDVYLGNFKIQALFVENNRVVYTTGWEK